MEIVFISTPSPRNSSIPPAHGTVDLGYCELVVVRKARDRILAPHQEVPPLFLGEPSKYSFTADSLEEREDPWLCAPGSHRICLCRDTW